MNGYLDRVSDWSISRGSTHFVNHFKFDMNPETFTLGALFKMGLHNFEESISEIVTAAVKEMSIEKGLKEVADVWDNEKFRRVFKKAVFILL